MAATFEVFGPYKLLKRLAAGGMAEIFLAVHEDQPDRLLALKRILPDFSDNSDFIAQFQREAYIVRQLKHPGIVAIKDSGVERRQLYLVMEYIQGKSLADILQAAQSRGKFMPIDLVTYLSAQIASALAYAHQARDNESKESLHIVHSDLSHHNVMVGFDGQVKIIDFGIARLKALNDISREAKIQGKLGYLSPEQVRREPVDSRTDIFALGIMMWEMVAFDSLFLASEPSEALDKVVNKEPPSLEERLGWEFKNFEVVIDRCLEKSPSARYQSMLEVREDIQMHLRPDSREHLKAFLLDHFGTEVTTSKAEYQRLIEQQKNPQSAAVTPTKTESPYVAEHLEQTATMGLTMAGASQARTSGIATPGESLSNTFLNALLILFFAAGLTLVVGQLLFPAQMLSLRRQLTGPAKPAELRLQIESEPNGAEVWLNDRSTGLVTPASLPLKNATPLSVSIRKRGYLPHTWKNVTPQPGQSLRTTLQKDLPAYLTFTSSKFKTVNLAINGMLYEDIELPLKNFSVQAGSDISIEVSSSSSPHTFKKQLRLGGGEKQTVVVDF